MRCRYLNLELHRNPGKGIEMNDKTTEEVPESSMETRSIGENKEKIGDEESLGIIQEREKAIEEVHYIWTSKGKIPIAIWRIS